MPYQFLLLFILYSMTAFSQDDLIQNIHRSVSENGPELIKQFKHIHVNPELSFQEIETSKMVEESFRKDKFEVITGLGKTGVVGILKNGKGPVSFGA